MRKLVSITFISFILVACSNEKIEFTGESDNWAVTYIAHVHDQDSQETELEIRYMGKDPAPKVIDYKIDGTKSVNRTLHKESSSISSKGNCSGCGVLNKNDEIKVVIKWKGKSESFILKAN